MDLFERVISARGRLLRVEQYADPEKRGAKVVPGLLMTFDVGHILIWGDAKATMLQLEQIPNPDEVPNRLIRLDEKEPWWRILGSPLTAVQSLDEKTLYRLQFRESDRSPRTISLTLEGDRIRIGVEKAAIEPMNAALKSRKTQ